jgi:hypothetical protein
VAVVDDRGVGSGVGAGERVEVGRGDGLLGDDVDGGLPLPLAAHLVRRAQLRPVLRPVRAPRRVPVPPAAVGICTCMHAHRHRPDGIIASGYTLQRALLMSDATNATRTGEGDGGGGQDDEEDDGRAGRRHHCCCRGRHVPRSLWWISRGRGRELSRFERTGAGAS